jgi:hypothetical protein
VLLGLQILCILTHCTWDFRGVLMIRCYDVGSVSCWRVQGSLAGSGGVGIYGLFY